MRNRRSATLVLVAVLALAPVAFACSGDDDVAPPETTVPETTTTLVLSTYPLTGVATIDAAAAGDHAAVVVKVDNGINSRPQTGLARADIVFEEEVEGVTRLASVFHSEIPEVVGNVRSGRSSDVDIVAQLSKPVFAWSGGNPIVTNQILDAQRAGLLTDASVNVATPAYYRSDDRRQPYNLYVHPGQLFDLVGVQEQGAPAPIFTYRAEDDPLPAGAIPVAGVSIVFTSFARVTYAWDAERKAWDRFQIDSQNDQPASAFVDSDGPQVAPQNVVVLKTPYGISAADRTSPQAFTVGEGDAMVFTAGAMIPGRWVRPTANEPVRLLDAAGAPIPLTPGRTWVALPRIGAPVDLIDQPTADAFLAVRR
ncbi:MAG TPA: DUF3048 domain-containing protein [Acidimicrobiales bacterium]